MDHLSLTDRNLDDRETSSRLKSIARYESFEPQALACSPPMVESYSAFETSRNIEHAVMGNNEGASSLGAVAGSHGVAVFRLFQPQSPLMILSHAFQSDKKVGGVSGLSFQPTASRSLHLASSRGTGVLVWDVSGHSLSPLWGRLAMDVGFGGKQSDTHLPIVSIAWQPEANNSPLLSATTESAACLWDLRQHSSTATFRPSLRFGHRRDSSGILGSAAPYVQIACGRRDECAILDAAGMLRIFDTRMTDRTRTSLGALCSFSALHHAGVGLSSLKADNDCWVTWGLDAPGVDAVVKVWSRWTDTSVKVSGDADDYWFMDTSPGKTDPSATAASYEVVGECSSPNLACARVCPAPIEDSIVTVQFEDDSAVGWRANLWKLKQSGDDELRRMEPITSFGGGRDVEKSLENMERKDAKIGSIRAAELALSSQILANDVEVLADDGSMRLLLCTVTENGFIAVHVSEVNPFRRLCPAIADFALLVLRRYLKLCQGRKLIKRTDDIRPNVIDSRWSRLLRPFGSRRIEKSH